MLPGPSFALAGAFFPSWMLCIFVAIIATLIIRALFIFIGLDDRISYRLTTYSAMTVAISCALALLIYGR